MGQEATNGGLYGIKIQISSTENAFKKNLFRGRVLKYLKSKANYNDVFMIKKVLNGMLHKTYHIRL